jgi:acetylornithine deacetylase
MNLVQLTRRLIDIPSPTGEEMRVGRFLESFLKYLGYQVQLQEIAPNRANVIATAGDLPKVVLSTHMDTVPPHIGSSEDSGHLYGRGACDAKGIMAAQVFAADKLRSEGINEVGLLFTVDEEAGSEGAAAANYHPIASACRFLINGEPTNNKLALGSKGSLRVQIKTEGRAAHSAYPEHGESAIEKLLDVLADIRKCNWPTDDYLGETTCNIGTIRGGVRPNVIPAHAEADLQIRLTTSAAPVKQMLEDVVDRRAQLNYLSVTEPVRMLGVEGFEQTIVRFTTDIPHLTNWGTPLLLGPGSILDAHTAHERVAISELSQAVDLYARLVRTLLATTSEEVAQELAEGARER